MADGRFPHTVGFRVNDAQQAKIDAGARLQGVLRADYAKQATLERADRDLRAAVEEPSLLDS